MSNIEPLTLDVLEKAVAGGAAAIRAVTDLQPAGGPGDKVFPPTYAVERNAPLKYAVEERRVNGELVTTVLLDSVASQANRMEEALLDAWTEQNLPFPVIAIDFCKVEGLADLDRITTLQAPHRIADALFRDSVDEQGRFFRDTEVGQAYTDACTTNATAVYEYCPTALVFGVWDSTGPKGGLGQKFPRILVSEIVGIGAHAGVKTASRIDPAGIQANVPVYHRRDNRDDWTINEDEALMESKKPKPFSRKGAEGKGKPSAINHSNVAPSIDTSSGGVTIDRAQQTTVLSLAGLRRLRFQTDSSGKRLGGEARVHAEHAARTAVAALGLAAIAFQRARGFDLRSRSLLVPTAGPLTLEVVPVEGGEPSSYPRYALDAQQARSLLEAAHKKAAQLGFGWNREPLRLVPAPKLADLIRKSRELAARGEADDGEGGNG